MKIIKLPRGYFTLVDDEDFEKINSYNWSVSNQGYAVRKPTINGKTKSIFMHHLVLKPPEGLIIDHINGISLDNRRENLRIATYSQNLANIAKSPKNTSGYKGVSWCKDKKRWRAYIKVKGKFIYLGHFTDKIEAAKAYDKAALKHFGEFARLNNIKKGTEIKPCPPNDGIEPSLL